MSDREERAAVQRKLCELLRIDPNDRERIREVEWFLVDFGMWIDARVYQAIHSDD